MGLNPFPMARDKPNYLVYTYEPEPIPFQWASDSMGNHFEPHIAMVIPLKIEGLPHSFYFQLDTGAPTSIIYGKPLKKLESLGINYTIIQK